MLHFQQLRESKHVLLFLGWERPQTFCNSSWISVLEYSTELFPISSTVWNLLPLIISPQDLQRDGLEVLSHVCFTLFLSCFSVSLLTRGGKKKTKPKWAMNCFMLTVFQMLLKLSLKYHLFVSFFYEVCLELSVSCGPETGEPPR